MIVTQTPLRIPLGGGGTDIPSYYTKYGGFVLSAAINKYCYVTLHSNDLDKRIKVSHSEVELVKDVFDIKHSIYREAFIISGFKEGVEAFSSSDVPTGTGLGGSGSFTVGLLHALWRLKGKKLSTEEIAELACHIEIDILREPSGKQDQYMAAYGGIHCLDIDREGHVKVTALNVSDDTIEELNENTLIFYTGISRKSSDVLKNQHEASLQGERNTLNCLHRIKEIGQEIKYALEHKAVNQYGKLMNEHWKVKKQMSSAVSNSLVDSWYTTAIENGATGGKIMGAGKGGFFIFHCEDGKERLRQALTKEGLVEVQYRFDFEGSKVLLES